LIAGCEKEDDKESPPEIPPATTFVIDFSDFPSQKSATLPYLERGLKDIQTTQNWAFAATNVFVWSAIITVHLVIPVAAFVESFNHDPEYQSDLHWICSYSCTVAGPEYFAELHGTLGVSEVEWAMYISSEIDTTKFLWFEGESSLLVTEGTWTLYYNPEDPAPYLGIEWQRNVDDETLDIKYTNIIPEGAENGSYISHGIVNETPYDAFYEIYRKRQENTIDIEWSRTTKEGRVRDFLHFEDNLWHCWDATLIDIDCN